MNNSHVQDSNHMDQHHQHSNAHPEHSPIPCHKHLSPNDHHSMMEMYFHTGFSETILFEQWITSTTSLFVLSWIFIFILGVLYEGIKKLSGFLQEERLMKRPIISNDANEHELERMTIQSHPSPSGSKNKIPPSYIERALQSVLYAVHLALSYMLMLVAMTFNVYLFFAIIFGVGTGYLVFARNRVISSTNKNQPNS